MAPTAQTQNRDKEYKTKMNKRKILKAFKTRGLTPQAETLTAFVNVLTRENFNDAEAAEMATALITAIKARAKGSASSVVTPDMLAQVVAELNKSEEDVVNEAVQLLDGFHTKRLVYDAPNKQFYLQEDEEKEAYALHAGPEAKVEMYRQRFSLAHQRVLRNHMFRKGLHKSGSAKITLTPVESLVGRSSGRFHCYILGMITQAGDTPGQYYLEDLTSSIIMDLSKCEMVGDGMITEGCIVLVEGEVVDGLLYARKVGHPPAEGRDDSLDVIGYQSTDIFGAIGSAAQCEQLVEQEIEVGLDSMFVVLSDVYLDQSQVFEKLEILFNGYQAIDPLPIFVFMGNFTSSPLAYAKGGVKQMIGYYEELGNLISKFPLLAKDARFIFIPGPQDPGSAKIFPRPAIPSLFTSSLRNKVSHATFTTNPCRIRFFSKEIVFFRENIVNKMRRCSILKASNTDEDNLGKHAENFARTIIDQGHLCPLPMITNPIYWQHDQTMRLYPLPDIVISGDNFSSYHKKHLDCHVANPGSFPVDFNFLVYRPVYIDEGSDSQEITSAVELSSIEQQQ